jgi:hypothetical protein
MSTSNKPTSIFLAVKPKDSWADTVLLPTPPFPDSTNIFRFTLLSRSLTSAIAGSGFLASPEAQSAWLGHPEQADDLPASSLLTPGQCSGASSGLSSGELDVCSSAGDAGRGASLAFGLELAALLSLRTSEEALEAAGPLFLLWLALDIA